MLESGWRQDKLQAEQGCEVLPAEDDVKVKV